MSKIGAKAKRQKEAAAQEFARITAYIKGKESRPVTSTEEVMAALKGESPPLEKQEIIPPKVEKSYPSPQDTRLKIMGYLGLVFIVFWIFAVLTTSRSEPGENSHPETQCH